MYVSIIIPVWNNWQYTRACLASLAQFDDARMEVVVVDNGSTDDTRDLLDAYGKKLFQERFVCVRHEHNLGFAIACNAGAQASSGDLLFFLNNDTTVTENWLSPLLETLAMPNIVAVGPLLLYPDGTCQHCGVSFTPLRNPFHLYANFPGSHPALRSKHPLQAITGAALMARKADFFAAGQFNPEYRNGFEDLDLCCCLRQRGGELAIAPESVIIHHESKTPGRHNDEHHNASLFSQRWGDFIRPDMHKQVAVDGYELKLSPMFASYAILSPVNQKMLNDQFKASSINTLVSKLEEEPLWFDGYLCLEKRLEEQKQYEMALDVATKAIRLFPLDAVQRAILRCARFLKKAELVETSLRLLRQNNQQNDTKNRKAALYFLEKAQEWKDHELANIFKEWLKNYS